MFSNSEKKLTKQEIYQKIRESSKDEYILSEMIRLGFWSKESGKPTLTEAFIKERGDLQRKLRELGREKSLYDDPQKALQELHKQRKKEALERREENRRKHNQRRFERAWNWYEKQKETITYLGQHVSSGLFRQDIDTGRLQSCQLPLIGGAKELSDAMGITLNELRFLAYQKEVSNLSHYQTFSIAKKSGGERKISAPMPRLKRAQYWLLENVLDKVTLTDQAHGFVKKRNIVTNAVPHVGQSVVINLDLENFFPTISYPRVKGIYKQLGYSEHLATIMALLTTEPLTEYYELDGQPWFVQMGEAFLPQGAPTSPALSNIICRRLDKRLGGMSVKLGFEYTRYADDLTFSSSTADNTQIKQLLWRCKAIVADEGFVVHKRKTKIMRKHHCQEVTGVVVNDKPSVNRKELRIFRALLFQIDKDGPDGKRWGNTGNLFNSIDGYANFVAMVNPEKGTALQKQVVYLKRKYGYRVKPGKILELNKKLFRAKAASGQAPREGWWQAQPGEPPELERTAQEIKEARDKEREANNPKPQQEESSTSQQRARANAPSDPQVRRPVNSRDQGETNPKSWGVWMFILFILFYIILHISQS